MRKKLTSFIALVLCALFVQPLIADDEDNARRKRDADRKGDARTRHPEPRADRDRRDRDHDRYRDNDRNRDNRDRYDNRNRDRYRNDYRDRDRRWRDNYVWRGHRSRLSFSFYFGTRPYWYPWYRSHYVCVPGRWVYDRYEDDEYWVDGYCYDPRLRYPQRYYYR